MRADPDHLDKILSNLLSNAFKFTPPGGEIGLAVWDEDGEAVVRVNDSGVGIASGDLPHVFERFYRADRAHSTLGSGIGLSLVEQLVTLHGGTVHVDSTEGEGTHIHGQALDGWIAANGRRGAAFASVSRSDHRRHAPRGRRRPDAFVRRGGLWRW